MDHSVTLTWKEKGFRHCKKCQGWHHMNNQNEWEEKEFNRQIILAILKGGPHTTKQIQKEVNAIRNLLAQQKQKDRERTKRWAKKQFKYWDPSMSSKDVSVLQRFYSGEVNSYNEALNDLLDFLSDKGDK